MHLRLGGGITGFQVFPPPTTPPEPAPPDHAGLGINNNSQMIASNSSLDEITCNKNTFLQNFQCGFPFIINKANHYFENNFFFFFAHTHF